MSTTEEVSKLTKLDGETLRGLPTKDVMPYKLEMRAELGAGGYGQVVKASCDKDGKRVVVAAKLINRSRMKAAAIMKEINLMYAVAFDEKGKPDTNRMIVKTTSRSGVMESQETTYVDGPEDNMDIDQSKSTDYKTTYLKEFIIGLRGNVEIIDKNYVIYMELADGELFSRVIDSGSLSEDAARKYFFQLMLAVKHMHDRGIVHRDLKLENVLLTNDTCKVCDFGLAHQYEKDGKGGYVVTGLKEICGSKSYCAPEVLEGKREGYQGYPTDVWSCGICLFAMLAGFFPLDEASGSDWRFKKIQAAQKQQMSVTHTIFGFYDRACSLTQECTDLIDAMLTIDPSARIKVGPGSADSATTVLDSAWVNNKTYRTPYRGMAAMQQQQFNPVDIEKMLAQESDEYQRPTYRGLGDAWGHAKEYGITNEPNSSGIPQTGTPLARQSARDAHFASDWNESLADLSITD